VEYVAARLKLEPERISAIESGAEPLARDGRGRSTARSLAAAIGADSEAAAGLLVPAEDPPRRPPAPRRVFTGATLGAALSVLALLVGLAILALRAAPPTDAPSERQALVHRPDYVGRLLGDERRAALEPGPPVRQTPPRP
jgi:hypothetical protein